MSDWLPSLNSLRAFEATSRHLSYQRAAAELRVTPAAVKQLVSKLETSVDVQLIQRKGRGLELTERGVESQGDLAAAMRLLESCVSKMRKPSKETRLFISVESSFATAWLVPKLNGFRALYPNVTVLIDSNQSIVDIDNGSIDIAIRYGVKSHGDLVIHRLFNDKVFPACSPSQANGPKPLQALKDISTVPLIHWDITQIPWAQETAQWFSWHSWLAQFGAENLSTKKGLYFSEYGQAVQAAIAGQGVILASWPILRPPLEAGLLVVPFKEHLATNIGYELVATKETAKQPHIDAFIEWICGAAKLEGSAKDPFNPAT